MKANEIRKCDACGRGLCADGHITFHRLTFERFGLDRRAIEERQGLALMMGTTALTEVFASRRDVANRIGEADDLILCETCAMQPQTPMHLAEIAAKRKERKQE